MPTMCVILANATTQDWEINHVDIKSAYLNVMLKETIYMKALMSLLIRYAQIPFYFHFSFTFSTLPIHHYPPPL